MLAGVNTLRDNKRFREYKTWLVNAKPNDKFIYFTGNSLQDNIVGKMMQPVVMEDALEGFVHLVQKKEIPFVYNFIAIKASQQPSRHLIPSRLEITKMRYRRVSKW